MNSRSLQFRLPDKLIGSALRIVVCTIKSTGSYLVSRRLVCTRALFRELKGVFVGEATRLYLHIFARQERREASLLQTRKPHCYKHLATPTGSQEISVKLWSIWNITSLLTLIIKMNVLSASRMLTLGWHIHHSDSSKKHCIIMNSSYDVPK